MAEVRLVSGQAVLTYHPTQNRYTLETPWLRLALARWGVRYAAGVRWADQGGVGQITALDGEQPGFRVRVGGEPALVLEIRALAGGFMLSMPGQAAVLLDGQVAGLDPGYLFLQGWQSWLPGCYRQGAVGRGQDMAMLTASGWESLLLGFLQGRQGSGTIRVDGRRLHIHHPAGEPVWVAAGQSPPHLLDGYLGLVAARHGVTSIRPSPVGWCSWYAHQQYVTEADVVSAVASIRARLPQLEWVQVDAGYQKDHNARPHGGAGDWLEANAKFPHGLQWLSDHIHQRGLKAGLWLAPFLTTAWSEFARQHPQATFEPSTPVYWLTHPCRIVDGSQVAARQWLQHVGTRLTQDLGFDFLKLDFLYAAADRSVEALRQGLESLRQGASSAYLLGCGAPLLPSVGLVDGMRTGADVGPRFDAPYGVVEGIRALTTRGGTHGRWWVGDLDCLLLKAPINRIERQSHVTAMGMSGGQVLLSDRLEDLTDGDVADLDRILPPHAYRVHTWPGAAMVWTGAALVVALFNRSWLAARRQVQPSPASILRMLGVHSPPLRWHVFDYWSASYLGCQTSVDVWVPAHGCRLLRLTAATQAAQWVGCAGHMVSPRVEWSATVDHIRVSADSPVWVWAPRRLHGRGWTAITPRVWRTPGAGDWAARLT